MGEEIASNYQTDISRIRDKLQQIIVEVIGDDIREIPEDVPILDLGISSLALVEGLRRVYDQFGVLVSIRRILEAQISLDELALIIDQDLNRSSVSNHPSGVPTQWKEQQKYSLAESQRHIGFLCRYSDEASAAFNEALTFRIIGPFDGLALQAAVEEVGNRYEALRTILDLDSDSLSIGSGEPLEVITSSVSDEELEQRFAEIVGRPFEIGKRLFRAELLRLSPTVHILVLVGHSIVLDYQALEFILQDIVDVYWAFARNEQATAAPPVIQWKDYLAMDKTVEAKEAQYRSELYWKEVFSSGVPRLEMPGDYPRPPVKKYKGARLEVPMDAGLDSRFRDWAIKYECKPETLLFAAFSGYLHRLTDQKDLVIGVESEPVYPNVGMRAIAKIRNMLPVRSIFDSSRSFRSHAIATQDLIKKADANKHLSFSELIQVLQLPPDQSRSAFFTAAFRSWKQGAVPDFGSFDGAYILPPSSGARYDLEVIAVFSETGTILLCDYSSELFEEQTISRWLHGILVFLNSGLENSDRPCGRLAMMPDDELRRLIFEWNQTERSFCKERTVLDSIIEQGKERPNQTALSFNNVSINYAHLQQRIDTIAVALHRNNVKKGDHVGVLINRSLDLIPALLAVWRVGALYVPMDKGFPKSRLAYMVENANVETVITDHELISLIENTGVARLFIEELIGEAGSVLDTIIPASGSDNAMILFTSGSTGKPKGVTVRHSSLLNCLLATKDYLEFSSQSRMLAITTISFDISSNELFMPLMAGGSVEIGGDDLAANGIRLAELIETHHPSHVQATVSTWKDVLTAGWKGNPEICLISAGEALDRGTAEQLLQKCHRLWNLYGPTETTVFSAAYQVTSAPGKPMRIGHPFPNTQIYILDKSYQPVPVGAVGDLHIGGEGLAAGYWQKPELTSERFVSNPFRAGERIYRTGDLARYLPDGSIVCLGRNDDQVKIHGVRIELGEIEAVLRKIPGIKDAVVAAWDSPQGDVQLVGHLLTNGKAALPGQEIRMRLREQLAEVMLPTCFLYHESFPLTANGKIHRAALPQPVRAWQDSEEHKNLDPPSTSTERTLAKIWAGVLGVDSRIIGRNSDFMDLGGHSLLMTKLMLEVRKLYQIDFNLREFFAATTLLKFAAFLDQQQPQEAGSQVGNRRSHAPRSLDLARQRMAFLQREAQLPLYVAPARGLKFNPQGLSSIFLTGATGFLGAYLIAEILKTSAAEIFCLVRPRRGVSGKDRIEGQLRKYEVWVGDEAWQLAWDKRLHAVDGDVTLPRLGIPDPVYERLAVEVDAILHGAAHVNFIYPYEALRATNVLGLHEIIQFAFFGRIKPIHHISTAAVWPMGSQYTYLEADSIDHNGALNLGYDEAKWVGEKCLLHAAERGLPVARYRPGEVGGDSISGHCVTDHFLFACLKGFLQFGAFPKLDIEVDVAPVDYVAKALVYLMFQRNPLNRAFHLTNPNRRRMSDALEFLRNRGYQFIELPFEVLRDNLVNSQGYSQNALFAYQAVLEDMDNLSMELPTYDTSQIQTELAGSGISCPPADEKLLDTYLGYLQQIDFLPQPDPLIARI